MARLSLFASIALFLPACSDMVPGRVIYTEDANGRYVQLRTGWGNYVRSQGAEVEARPELEDMHEVHGDLTFICSEINGIENPRIVVESKNAGRYQVVYKWGDREALKVIARPLGLVVTEENRELQAITIRVAPGGHRLQPGAKGVVVNLAEVHVRDTGWPLEGVTMDQLARFLEQRYRRPVVNLTAVEGRWSIVVSDRAARMFPGSDETAALDGLGLELRWETVTIPVTVVKDRPPSED
jgi:hypothetical protein